MRSTWSRPFASTPCRRRRRHIRCPWIRMRRRGPWRWGRAYVALFWCARAIFARGGVRLTTRGIAWLGLGLTVLVAIQRATRSKALVLDVAAARRRRIAATGRSSTATASLAGWRWRCRSSSATRSPATSPDRRARAPAAGIDSTQLWLGGAAVLMTGGLLGSLSRGGIFGGAMGLLVFVLLSRTRLLAHAAGSPGWWRGSSRWWRSPRCYANLGALALRMQETTELGEWGRRGHLARHLADGGRLPAGPASAPAPFSRGCWSTSRRRGSSSSTTRTTSICSCSPREASCSPCRPRSRWPPAIVMMIAPAPRPIAAPSSGSAPAPSPASPPPRCKACGTPALRTPANGVLFAVVAAIALHDPRKGR